MGNGGDGFYSPSPEYPVATRLELADKSCYRDEWRGEPRRSSKSEGGSASAQFRFDTPQLAAGSFISRHPPLPSF